MSRRVRTFLDTSVPIAAWRGNCPHSLEALSILGDPGREFVSSDLVMLETLPQAAYHQQRREQEFHDGYFNAAPHWVLPAVA